MTKEDLARQLDNSEYPLRLSKDLVAAAKTAGLVIVFGASDDLMEFRGAIDDELDAFEGRKVFLLAQEGLFEEVDCHCRYAQAAKARAETTGVPLEAVWDQDGYSWVFETTIPHVTFEIVEGEEKYCRGIVFALADVGRQEPKEEYVEGYQTWPWRPDEKPIGNTD